MAVPHCGGMFFSALIQRLNVPQQHFRRKFLLLQYTREALLFKGRGIENLVAPAGFCGKRYQQMRLFQREKFRNGVAPRARNDEICCREQVCQPIGNVFKLFIALLSFSSVSRCPFPQRCTMSKVSSRAGRQSRRQLFSFTAPREPPICSSTGFFPSNPQAARPFFRLPVNSSPRMGVPV